MLAGGLAFAQATPPAPYSAMDAPPAAVAPSDTPAPYTTMDRAAGMPTQTDSAIVAFQKLDTSNQGYVTRSDIAQLPGFVAFDAADRNRDGRLDVGEFERAWADHGSSGGQ